MALSSILFAYFAPPKLKAGIALMYLAAIAFELYFDGLNRYAHLNDFVGLNGDIFWEPSSSPFKRLCCWGSEPAFAFGSSEPVRVMPRDARNMLPTYRFGRYGVRSHEDEHGGDVLDEPHDTDEDEEDS